MPAQNMFPYAGSLPATNFPQSAPFPPALDPHYAEYMQHMSQQQVFPGAPLSTLTHVERASNTGKEATSQSSSSKVRVKGTSSKEHASKSLLFSCIMFAKFDVSACLLRGWFSGRIVPCHGTDPGSIPGSRMLFCIFVCHHNHPCSR